jgi:hypothetical protein
MTTPASRKKEKKRKNPVGARVLQGNTRDRSPASLLFNPITSPFSFSPETFFPFFVWGDELNGFR